MPLDDVTVIVVLSGLEPPTSRLSAGCSNQLSYRTLRYTSTMLKLSKYSLNLHGNTISHLSIVVIIAFST